MYLRHSTPSSGIAKDSEDVIISLLGDENCQVEKMVAVCCDGINVNTDRKN